MTERKEGSYRPGGWEGAGTVPHSAGIWKVFGLTYPMSRPSCQGERGPWLWMEFMKRRGPVPVRTEADTSLAGLDLCSLIPAVTADKSWTTFNSSYRCKCDVAFPETISVGA